jgi:two-component system chemotaxis sensor kinase CheA
MNELDTCIKEFLVESYENLDRLDHDLVLLEKDPRDCERLSSIFRTIHTIKGTCGFFGFSRLESVTHVGENLLSRLRDGQLLLDPERTSALLALVDAIRDMLASIEKTGSDGNRDYQELID